MAGCFHRPRTSEGANWVGRSAHASQPQLFQAQLRQPQRRDCDMCSPFPRSAQLLQKKTERTKLCNNVFDGHRGAVDGLSSEPAKGDNAVFVAAELDSAKVETGSERDSSPASTL